MITPHIIIGRAGTPVLLEVGVGYDDDGTDYEMLATSQPIAPAGPGGECIFTLLYLTTRHYSSDVSVWITPIVDRTELATQRLDLTGVLNSKGELQTHEIGLSIPYIVATVERLRYAPRGTWFSVRIETKYGDNEVGAAPAPAQQIVESVELEYEVVRESQVAID